MARKESLPPGFRFHPTDVELVMYYLKRKVLGKRLHAEAIAEVNIYKFSPWDLPDMSCLKFKDLEWFFFCPMEKKYTSGVRVKRATENGFWKATGKDRPIHYGDVTVGMVKSLVFHLGHAPKGERTDWVIHEYRICDDQLATSGLQDSYVLCKVFKKNGPGPKIGAQYGAPFNEDDWSDDEVIENLEVPPLTALLPEKKVCIMSGLADSSNTVGESFIEEDSVQKKKSVVTDSFEPGSTTGLYSSIQESPGYIASQLLEHESDDDIIGLLASFTDDTSLLINGNGNHEDHLNGNGENQSLILALDGCDIYSELHDLNNLSPVDQERLDFSGMQNDNYASLYNLLDNMDYIELNDLLAPAPSNCSPAIENDPLFDTFGLPSYNNMSQFCFGCHHPASNTNQLAALADQPYKEDSGLNVRHEGNLVDNQFYPVPNAVYDSMTRTQRSNWENGGCHFDQSMNSSRR